MKAKRNKANRRTMSIYTSIFKFREPYQVLFDADFAITAITQKMDVVSRLQNVLGGTVKPMITQCSISHLVKLASEGSQVAQEAVDLTRELCERRKCNHWKTKASSIECIKGILGETDNPLRYMICTQDANFRSFLRDKIVAVPIIYLNRSGTLLLEQEGPATELRRKKIQEDKLHVPAEELEQLNATTLGQDSNVPVQLIERNHDFGSLTNQGGESSQQQTNSAQKLENKLMKNKKRKKKGGPNPLSVKKKKNKNKSSTSVQLRHSNKLKSSSSTTTTNSSNKRKRKNLAGKSDNVAQT